MYFSVYVSITSHTLDVCSSPFLHQRHDFSLTGARDARLVLADEHVDLGAHAKSARIYTRFDRESRARDQAAIVVGLVVVHMDAISVNRPAQAVARAMNELAAVACSFHHLTARAVDLEPANLTAGADSRLHQLD